jgi:trigger factor
VSVQLVEENSCKRSLVVEVPAEVVDKEVERLAREYAARAKVPGFRPGKVPLGIIRQRYGSELRSDATQDLIQRYWRDALKEHALRPLSEPVIEDLHAEPGTPMKFKVSFEVLPPLDIRNYKGVPATIPSSKVEDTDVEAAIQELRERHAEFVPVEDTAIKDGHFATLSVEGEFGGGEPPLKEDDVVCAVGDPRTNSTFSENLQGARIGDERAFAVSYPDDYHRKRFAGKTVDYKVRVKEVKEKVLPEPNDDFAKDFGGADTLEALRLKIRDDLVRKAEESAEKVARQAVLDTVVRSHSFEIPETLVHEELRGHAEQVAGSLARRGVDVNEAAIDWKKILEEERPNAEDAVRRTLVLDAVARQEGIEVTDQELDEQLEKIAQASHKSLAAIRAQLEKDKRIQAFKDHLRQKKALDFMFRNATISRG